MRTESPSNILPSLAGATLAALRVVIKINEKLKWKCFHQRRSCQLIKRRFWGLKPIFFSGNGSRLQIRHHFKIGRSSGKKTKLILIKVDSYTRPNRTYESLLKSIRSFYSNSWTKSNQLGQIGTASNKNKTPADMFPVWMPSSGGKVLIRPMKVLLT